MEAETLGDQLNDAQALVDKVANSIAEVESDTLGDTLSDAQAMVDTLADLGRQLSRRWLTCKQR